MIYDNAGNPSRKMSRGEDRDVELVSSDDVVFDPNADPAPDPVLATLLREVNYQATPTPDWERLRRAIADAATIPLMRRRWGTTWWYHAAAWAGRAIPIGLAASIALVFGLRAVTLKEPAPAAVAQPRLTVETVLAGVIEDALETIVPASRDDLLRAAILIED